MSKESFLKSLFSGVIPDGVVFPWPELPVAEADTLHVLLDAVRKFCAQRVDSAIIDRQYAIDPSVLQGLRELGVFGLAVPKEHGGLGLPQTAYARVIQELAAADASVALTVGAHQSIGLQALLLFGTEDQRRRFLPRLASGESLAAFALTEPGAGSDAAAIQTRAVPTEGGYLLSGSKLWVTNGGLADLFTVFARTSSPEEGAKPRITAFLVERSERVRSGPNERKLGIRGTSTTPVFFDDAFVPEANVVGEKGRGFKVAMEVLNHGRLGLAAGCIGQCRTLLRLSTERAQKRRAFGRPIGEFGFVKDKIARMLSELFALESMVYLTTGLVDGGAADFSVESAACKVFGSETLWRVANEALQIAAGVGYMEGFPYERLLRDARIHLVFAGTNEILRAFIALSGMQGPSLELAEVSKAMREPIKGFGVLSDIAVRKARSALGRRERMVGAHPVLAREAVIFEEYVQELAKATSKVLRRHGKDIAEMQYTQRRVADVAIDLYAIAAVIARTSRVIERRGEEGARREIDHTAIFVAQAEKRLAANVASFDRNDDELRKAIASRAYVDGGYPFDVV
jgi:acyl-CoA dehydrogenase family protein 9